MPRQEAGHSENNNKRAHQLRSARKMAVAHVGKLRGGRMLAGRGRPPRQHTKALWRGRRARLAPLLPAGSAALGQRVVRCGAHAAVGGRKDFVELARLQGRAPGGQRSTVGFQAPAVGAGTTGGPWRHRQAAAAVSLLALIPHKQLVHLIVSIAPILDAVAHGAARRVLLPGGGGVARAACMQGQEGRGLGWQLAGARVCHQAHQTPAPAWMHSGQAGWRAHPNQTQAASWPPPPPHPPPPNPQPPTPPHPLQAP